MAKGTFGSQVTRPKPKGIRHAPASLVQEAAAQHPCLKRFSPSLVAAEPEAAVLQQQVDAEQPVAVVVTRRQVAAVTQQQADAVELLQAEQQRQVAVDGEVAQLRQPDRLTPWSFVSLQPESS